MSTFSKEKKEGLHGWFSRNNGKGWINCKTGGPCGRKDSSKGSYPACRPTKSACKKYKKPKGKTSSKRYDWKKKEFGGKFQFGGKINALHVLQQHSYKI